MHRKPTSPRQAKGIVAKIRAQSFAADPLCYYCRCLTQLPIGDERHSHTATLDHKTPISRGGRKASKANLALCCYACNQAKADQTEAEFRARLGRTPIHLPQSQIVAPHTSQHTLFGVRAKTTSVRHSPIELLKEPIELF